MIIESSTPSRLSLIAKGAGEFEQAQTKLQEWLTLHNLIEDDFPALHNNTSSMDLITCRNVTIYFTEETTRGVVKKFYRALVDGGWLVVGHAEPSRGDRSEDQSDKDQPEPMRHTLGPPQQRVLVVTAVPEMIVARSGLGGGRA